MSDLTKDTAGRAHQSSISKELQNLIDQDEQFKDNYGDFENSWTSTRIKDEFSKIPSSESSRQEFGQGGIKKPEPRMDSGGHND
ncbi:hypothetical protein BDV59DRAFT_173774 [Aspergillus ambiguus]|uniref:uncharacterized protein n=1 Tax=Aspergillus ambiguus TaxID=176160 RepID=UPI003CCCE3B0